MLNAVKHPALATYAEIIIIDRPRRLNAIGILGTPFFRGRKDHVASFRQMPEVTATAAVLAFQVPPVRMLEKTAIILSSSSVTRANR
jgi:hypothetical protein